MRRGKVGKGRTDTIGPPQSIDIKAARQWDGIQEWGVNRALAAVLQTPFALTPRQTDVSSAMLLESPYGRLGRPTWSLGARFPTSLEIGTFPRRGHAP